MIQKHRSTPAVSLRVIIAALGNLYFGYALGYYGITQGTIVHILGYQDSVYKSKLDGLLNSLLPIGGAFGAMFSSRIVQRYGLRKSFLICDCFGIMIALGSLYLDWWSITLTRFLFGVIVGINASIDPQYVSQISPKSLSGILGVICQTFILLGLTIAFLMSWTLLANNPETYEPNISYSILGFNSWRVLFIFPAIPCWIRIIAFGFLYTKDLPSELLRKGDQTETKLALIEIYNDDYVDEILEELEEDLQLQRTKTTSKEMFGKVYRKRLLVGGVLSLLNQWSGINAISFYSLIIFEDITNSNFFWDNALSVMCQVVGMTVSLVSGTLINRLGRRNLYLIGNGICFITLSTLTISYFVLDQFSLTDQQFQFLQILIVISIITFIMAYNLSLGPVFWIYIAEILPSSGIGIVLVENWILLSLLAQFFPIISGELGVVVCLGFFAMMTFLGEIFIFFYVLETKKLTKTQIHTMFAINHDSVSSGTTTDGEGNDIRKNLKSVNE